MKRPRESSNVDKEEEKRAERRKKLEMWKKRKQQGGGTGDGNKAAPKKAESSDVDKEEEKRAERLKKLEMWKKRKQQDGGTEVGSEVIEAAPKKVESDDDVDPLDAFMSSLEKDCSAETQQELREASQRLRAAQQPKTISLDELLAGGSDADSDHGEHKNDDDAFHKDFMDALKKRTGGGSGALLTTLGNSNSNHGTIFGDDDDASDDEEDIFENEDGMVLAQRTQGSLLTHQKKTNRKSLRPVDHSAVDYNPFRKNFYREAPELKEMSAEDVAALRKTLEIRVRGKRPPNPIESWVQCGLSNRIMAVIDHHGWKAPFAIQRQAIPTIMSGRDVIAVAKTGSGKTLAFLLPMFRHVLDQPPLRDGDGPIALLMAPARELANQIHKEVRKFSKALGLKSISCYGGTSIKEQIGALKSGVEIVVATPGRLIDLLCTNAGRIVSLSRVTYIVLDEADRMFDMGFEPQVMSIVAQARPDKQIVLFSATFPVQVERLARTALKSPVEIVVGGRTKASSDIEQFVEVRSGGDKFARLLQLLGLWYEKGNILVFVDTQNSCDALFEALTSAGYPTLSLHGGKDQIDRDYTIQEYKSKLKTLMVATSVAGRGLDVPELRLVINYVVPNHIEDYIHRIGRTGRAGRKGTAYTFIAPDEARYAPDLVKALKDSKQAIPPELASMSETFLAKVKSGESFFRNSGFRGSGFTFEADEKTDVEATRDAIRKSYEEKAGLRQRESDHAAPPSGKSKRTESQKAGKGIEHARALAASFASKLGSKQGDPDSSIRRAKFEINDLPQIARHKISRHDAVERIFEITGCGLTCKGAFIPPGRKPRPGEEPLYLAIEGPSSVHVTRALEEIKRMLGEELAKSNRGDSNKGRYKVL